MTNQEKKAKTYTIEFYYSTGLMKCGGLKRDQMLSVSDAFKARYQTPQIISIVDSVYAPSSAEVLIDTSEIWALKIYEDPKSYSQPQRQQTQRMAKRTLRVTSGG